MIREVPREQYQYPVAELDYEANYYYAGSVSDTDYAYCHIQQVRHVGYMHLYIVRWGRRVLSELTKDFNELKMLLCMKGIKVLMGLYPIDGTEGKWGKLMRLMGFSDPGLIKVEGSWCYRVMMEVCHGN